MLVADWRQYYDSPEAMSKDLNGLEFKGLGLYDDPASNQVLLVTSDSVYPYQNVPFWFADYRGAVVVYAFSDTIQEITDEINMLSHAPVRR